MHCFTGSKVFAQKLLDLDFYISLSGIITFKNATELLDVVSFLQSIIIYFVTSSDSPPCGAFHYVCEDVILPN